MKMIIEFMKDINICYLILNFLLLIDFAFYLKQKNLKKLQARLILGAGIIVSFLLLRSGSGVTQSIFVLKYLSVKTYLLVIIIVNLITLFTINHRLKFCYELINYTFFILMAIIFGSTIAITVGNYFELLYIMDISNAITLMNLSFVIFMLYLIGISLIYIGYSLFSDCSPKQNKNLLNKNLLKNTKITLLQTLQEKKETARIHHENKKQTKLAMQKNKQNTSAEVYKDSNSNHVVNGILTPEELLGLEDKSQFYINGVECSIIFEDSNQENIVQNYYILSEDIHAKMVNGFTLEENQLLKSICNKLQVYNLNNIDINNSNVLNRVSVEEYNFLMKIMGVN